MRTIKHWTPRYVYDRLAVLIDERKNPDHPWLTADMVRILETWLKPTDVGLEFGSGRSTIWFANRLKKLTSVEHNKEWYRKVSDMLAKTRGVSAGGGRLPSL